jgi:hypothetical protein
MRHARISGHTSLFSRVGSDFFLSFPSTSFKINFLPIQKIQKKYWGSLAQYQGLFQA